MRDRILIKTSKGPFIIASILTKIFKKCYVQYNLLQIEYQKYPDKLIFTSNKQLMHTTEKYLEHNKINYILNTYAPTYLNFNNISLCLYENLLATNERIYIPKIYIIYKKTSDIFTEISLYKFFQYKDKKVLIYSGDEINKIFNAIKIINDIFCLNISFDLASEDKMCRLILNNYDKLIFNIDEVKINEMFFKLLSAIDKCKKNIKYDTRILKSITFGPITIKETGQIYHYKPNSKNISTLINIYYFNKLLCCCSIYDLLNDNVAKLNLKKLISFYLSNWPTGKNVINKIKRKILNHVAGEY